MISMYHQKKIYFIHVNHNPMISGPKLTTSCRDRLAKTIKDCDKPVFESQNEYTLVLSNIDVMFSVHGDSI